MGGFILTLSTARGGHVAGLIWAGIFPLLPQGWWPGYTAVQLATWGQDFLASALWQPEQGCPAGVLLGLKTSLRAPYLSPTVTLLKFVVHGLPCGKESGKPVTI